MKQLTLLLAFGMVLLGQGSSIPTQAKDISTPSAPPSGYTKVYTKGGKICSENSSAAENCVGAAAGGVTSITAGTGISVNAATGAVTVTNTAPGASPAGSTGAIQFNAGGGVFGGFGNWDSINSLMSLGGVPITPFPGLYVGPNESTLPALLQGWIGPVTALFTGIGSVIGPVIGIENATDDGPSIYAVQLVPAGGQPNIESEIHASINNQSGYAYQANIVSDGFTGFNATGFYVRSPDGTFDTVIAFSADDVLGGTNNYAFKSGAGMFEIGDATKAAGVHVKGAGAFTSSSLLWLDADTGVALPFIINKTTGAAVAPGAGKADMRWIAGTNAGTCKLVSNAGTNATEVTIIDNVGGSC